MNTVRRKNDLIVILLGSSKFPNDPQLQGSDSFSNSSEAIFSWLTKVGITSDQILNLFNCQDGPGDILSKINKFINGQISKDSGIKDLLIYYVGHGDLTPENDYYLAIQNTRSISRPSSSLMVRELSKVLNKSNKGLRKFLILDCCFAGNALTNFQSSTDSNKSNSKLADIIGSNLPPKGTSLLCSSSKWNQSKFLQGDEYTMFSDGLIQVLTNGVKHIERPFLTFKEIEKEVKEYISNKHGDQAVLPEIHSPDQRDGDIAEIDLLVNNAF